MKSGMVITHYGTRIAPGDVFIHQGEFLRLVYADPSQVTLRTNPFVTHPNSDNHYVQLAGDKMEDYGIKVRLTQERAF